MGIIDKYSLDLMKNDPAFFDVLGISQFFKLFDNLGDYLTHMKEQ